MALITLVVSQSVNLAQSFPFPGCVIIDRIILSDEHTGTSGLPCVSTMLSDILNAPCALDQEIIGKERQKHQSQPVRSDGRAG